MTTLIEDPKTESPILIRTQTDATAGQRVAVWSGVVGLSLLAWSVALAGLDIAFG